MNVYIGIYDEEYAKHAVMITANNIEEANVKFMTFMKSRLIEAFNKDNMTVINLSGLDVIT